MKRLRFVVVLLVTAALLSMWVSPALATEPPLDKFVSGKSTDSGADAAWGVAALHWLYPQPTSYDGDWVNSIYVRDATTGYFVETGWFWDHSSGTRVAFIHNYNGGQHEAPLDVFAMPVNTWLSFSMVSTSGDTWDIYTGTSVYRGSIYSSGVYSGTPAVGSETITYNYPNKGSWTYVQWRDSSTWHYWYHAAAEIDRDTHYNFFPGHVADSNHWVYNDAQ